jgi:MFS family permease
VAIPVLLFAVIAFGFFDGSVLALWVVYAFHQGQGEASAALSLSAIIMGNVVLQFPIGWLADRMSRRHLLAALAAVTFCGAAVLPLIGLGTWWSLLYLVIWGAAAFGVYTLSLTLIGQHLLGIQLVAATAAFGMAWGAGALAGPGITGFFMDTFGPSMLPLTVALTYGLLTAAALAMPPIRQSLVTLSRGTPGA